MRIQALYDLQQEINRLYIAGSKFAKNDPRLAKQLPVLNKLGEKVPVFKKLAQNIEELLQAETAESSEKLLNTGILLYSVLYTQGEMTEENGEPAELTPTFRLDELDTSASFLELKPVIDALTTTHQGRLAIVQDSFKQGIFNDFRTFEYLDGGLGDKYSELADYIEQTVIPSIGEKMLPFLKNNFSYEGRPEDIRRFRLLYRLKDNEIQSMIKVILEGSAIGLQSEAVKMLADDVANEELIIRLTDDKHKPVRESAYWALAQLNTKTGLEKLLQVFLTNKNKANLEGIVTAIQSGKMSFFLEDVYKKIRADLEAFCSQGVETDDKQWVAALDYLAIEFRALEDKKEDYIIRFWEEWITNDKFNRLISKKKNLLGTNAQFIVHRICIYLGKINNDAARQTLKRLFEHPLVRKNWMEDVAGQYFPVAAEEFGKEKMYDLFHPPFKEGKLTARTFLETYSKEDYDRADFFNNRDINPEMLDKRWFDLFVKAGEKDWGSNSELILLIIAGSGVQSNYSRTALKGYMEGIIKDKHLPYNSLYTFFTDRLMESGLPQRFELLTASLENNKYPGYNLGIYKHISEADYLKDFPKEYAKRFHEMYKKSNVEDYLDIAKKIEENQGKFQQLLGKIIK
jgi:hypothetical protein